MRTRSMLGVGAGICLLLAPALPARAATLVSYSVTVCADRDMFSAAQTAGSIRISDATYAATTSLVDGPGQQGVVAAADGCWRTSVSAPDDSTTIAVDLNAGSTGAYADACHLNTYGTGVAIPSGDRTFTFSLPSPKLVNVQVMSPSGFPVTGAYVGMGNPPSNQAGMTVTSESGSKLVNADATDEWGYGAASGGYFGCQSGTQALLFDNLSPQTVSSKVIYSTGTGPNSTATQTFDYSDDWSDGNLTATLPFDVPDVAAPTTGAPAASMALRTRTATQSRLITASSAASAAYASNTAGYHQYTTTVAYGAPVNVPVSVTQVVNGAPAPVQGDIVALTTYSPRGAAGSVLATSTTDTQGQAVLTASGLTTGTYLAGGDGFSSGATLATIGVLPQVPQAPGVTPANGAVTLHWRAPADGGSPLTSYTGWWGPAGGTLNPVQLPANATSWTQTALTNGTRYSFAVTANTAVGASPRTAVLDAYPGVPPQAPQAFSVTPGAGSATLRWRTPANGGSPLTSYTAYWGATGSTLNPVMLSSGTTAWTKTGLANGHSYSFALIARNAIGSSARTATLSVLAGRPTQVRAAAQPRSAAVVLSWTAPTSNGGYALTGYTVQFKAATSNTWSSAGTTSASVRSLTRTQLVNGHAYDFRVAARNASGPGPWSATLRLVAGTPTTPTSVVSHAYSKAVGLSWGTPSLTNGAPVNAYVVQYRLSSTTSWTTVVISPNARSWRRSASTGSTWVMRVAARNSRGIGLFSAVLAARAT